MNTSAVLGLGFGDEGKGVTTSFLCSRSNSNKLVVRFNGGHQAGHTVVHQGLRHVFSSFGSGTLQGVPTLLSRHCTFYPTAVRNEYEALVAKGIVPVLHVDPLCPVTTPYDVEVNRREEEKKRHGSVGVGFGSTLKRHEAYYKLYAQDLLYPGILDAKLAAIKKYYDHDSWYYSQSQVDYFMESIQFIRDHAHNIVISKPLTQAFFTSFDEIIFEGAQGILLDMDFGFFPNVTRSNTTSKNAREIIKEFALPEPDVYYVIRSYQTRHGNGFMTNETYPPTLELQNNGKETNVSHKYQGEFRKSVLDADLLKYAIACDKHFDPYHRSAKNLVITCLDQTSMPFPVTKNGTKTTMVPKELAEYIQIDKFWKVYHCSDEQGNGIFYSK